MSGSIASCCLGHFLVTNVGGDWSYQDDCVSGFLNPGESGPYHESSVDYRAHFGLYLGLGFWNPRLGQPEPCGDSPSIQLSVYISNAMLYSVEWRLAGVRLASPRSRSIFLSECAGCELGPLLCPSLWQLSHWCCFLTSRSLRANRVSPCMV